MELHSLSLWDIAEKLREGTLSAQALAESAIAGHARLGGPLNAYKLFLADQARENARDAVAAFKAGSANALLQGIPVSVKDLFAMAEHPVFAGSPRELPERFRADGPIVANLRRQRAIITGRTHTTEFAYGEHGYGTNSHWGTPWNPWDAKNRRPPGGSSSGAGVSLWEGSALVALGTDTTGSVREPAALTGTVALKVTHGRWPLEGIIPCSPSLDSPGPLTRTVEDLAFAFTALDPHGERKSMRRLMDAATLSGLRIGVADEYFWRDCTPSVSAGVKGALDELGRAGAKLVPMKLPEAVSVRKVFDGGDPCAAELYAFLSEELPGWIDLLNPALKPQVQAGGRMAASEYIRRWKLAADKARAFKARWDEVDVIALPTQPITPPTIAELAAGRDRRGDANEMRNTDWVSLLRLCAISMPAALDASGIPVGLQLVGPAMAEERLIAIASSFERVLGTARQRIGTPPLCPDESAT